jgi:hypothetical protein
VEAELALTAQHKLVDPVVERVGLPTPQFQSLPQAFSIQVVRELETLVGIMPVVVVVVLNPLAWPQLSPLLVREDLDTSLTSRVLWNATQLEEAEEPRQVLRRVQRELVLLAKSRPP